MTTTAHTALAHESQTMLKVDLANDIHAPHPIIASVQVALRFFRNALYAEKSGLRSPKKAFGISDPERRAATLWDKAEAAFGKAAHMPTVTQSETDLVTLCAQIAVYLDDADNAAGINPRRFRPKSGAESQTSGLDEATALIKAAKSLLATYDTLLPQATAPEVALAA